MLHLKQKFVFSSISSLILYYILIKSYFISVSSPSLTVPSVHYMMKHRKIFFMNALLHKLYGTNFDYIYLSEKVALPVLTPQSVIFGFIDTLDHNYLLVNHLLLTFKYNLYNSRFNNTHSSSKV